MADSFRFRGLVALCWSCSTVWKDVKVTVLKMSARLEGTVDLLDFLFQFRATEWVDLYLHWSPYSFIGWTFIIAALQQVIRVNTDRSFLSLTCGANALPIFFLLLTFWRRNYLFLNLSHSVYKMWKIQEPNTLELWNKLHFEEEKKRRVYTMFEIFNTYICWINI